MVLDLPYAIYYFILSLWNDKINTNIHLCSQKLSKYLGDWNWKAKKASAIANASKILLIIRYLHYFSVLIDSIFKTTLWVGNYYGILNQERSSNLPNVTQLAIVGRIQRVYYFTHDSLLPPLFFFRNKHNISGGAMTRGVQVTVAFAIAAAATEIFTENLLCVKSYVKHLHDFCHFTKPKTFF